MRILIAGSLPSVGGYEEELLVNKLEREYKNMKYDVDSFILPFSRDILSIPEQILAYQFIDTSSCDLLITIGYPACMLSHPNKVIYLFERMPIFDEYYDSEYGVENNYQYKRLKDTVNRIEKEVFSRAKKVLCNSKLLLEDIQLDFESKKEVLYLPVLEIEEKINLINRDYIMIETDLLPYNRPELIVFLAKSNPQYCINVFVPNEKLVYYETLVKWIRAENLEHRIQVIQRKASQEDYENALAYISFDYNIRRIPNSILMAMKNQIPIIVCKDCGALMEVLIDYSLFRVIDIDDIKDLELIELDKYKRQNKSPIKFNEIRFFAESLVNI